METLKVKREIATIWTLGAVSMLTVFFTHNRLFMLPLFVYIMYKCVRGAIRNRGSYLFIPYTCFLLMSFFGIYIIILKSLSQ